MTNKRMLYLMLGYPGAGKTTTAKVIHELTGAEHLWADLVRRDMFGTPKYTHMENMQLYGHMNNLAATLLSEGKSVVFDTNFSFYKDRERLCDIAEQHETDCVIIWVTTPKALSKKRATSDHLVTETRVLGNDFPEDKFERIASELEPPRVNERCIEVDGTKVSPDYIRKLLEDNQAL